MQQSYVVTADTHNIGNLYINTLIIISPYISFAHICSWKSYLDQQKTIFSPIFLLKHQSAKAGLQKLRSKNSIFGPKWEGFFAKIAIRLPKVGKF